MPPLADSSSLVAEALAQASPDALWAEVERRAAASVLGSVVDSPKACAVVLADIARKRKEYFVALYLDAARRVMAREVVSVGTLTASLVHPREVFGPALTLGAAALTLGAAALIVAHNHPSGDPEPSREDRETTRRLAECGRLLGVPLLDHVVMASRGFFSFRDRGLLNA